MLAFAAGGYVIGTQIEGDRAPAAADVVEEVAAIFGSSHPTHLVTTEAAEMAALYAPSAVLQFADGARYEGRAAIEGLYRSTFFSGLTLTTRRTLSGDDWAIAEYTVSGLDTSGKSTTVPGVAVMTISDGRITAERNYVDTTAVGQLRARPSNPHPTQLGL